jgi:exodeoxyribonuclease VII small subunit
MARSSKEKTPTLDELLSELGEIVTRLEDPEQPLEQSLTDFEQGVGMIREAQKLIDHAEQRVRILTESPDGEPVATPFSEPDADDVDD